MIKLLADNPLLLLFIVAAVGYPLGRIRIMGNSLGVAAVLFAGLAVGAVDPGLKLPEIIYVLGLVLFVYTVGLSSGADFIASLRQEGFRTNLLVISILVLATVLAAATHLLFGFRGTMAAGIFAGSLTNTPALAAALETIKGMSEAHLHSRLVSEPVVGYSIAYPMGVVGSLLAISIFQKIWRVDYAAEARELKKYGACGEQLQNMTIKVTNPESGEAVIDELSNRYGWGVVFGRFKHNGKVNVATGETRLQPGDLVVAVGEAEELATVCGFLGEKNEKSLPDDRSEFYYRRIFVSNQDAVGIPLKELNIGKSFGAVVTRVRRGDTDFLPTPEMVLELGDRVRVLANRGRMGAVTKFFGDSYHAVSEVDILTFGLGLAMGLLLGIVPFPLPGGITLKLGFAGGPLIVALVLGAVERTGPMVWRLPYSANQTLRQIGLTMFLAGIGTRAGYGFVSTLAKGDGLLVFTVGAAITATCAVLTLWVGHRLLKIPMSILTGILAGLMTQPAVLGFSQEQTRNNLPTIGYAAVYPVATITKILCAQLLLSTVPLY